MTTIRICIFMLLSSVFFSGVVLQFPYYAVQLKKVASCAKNKQFLLVDAHYNASKVNEHGINHWTVYEDITEEMNITVKPSVYLRTNNNWVLQQAMSKHSINNCIFMKYDSSALPAARLFLPIPYSCPLKKGIRLLTKDRVTSMVYPVIPFGCWMLKLEFIKPNENLVGCITAIIVQAVNSNLESESKLCY